MAAQEKENTKRTLNGLDLDQLFGTLDAIGGNPDIARFEFRAKNAWIDGGHNRTTVKEFYGACAEDTSRSEPFVFDKDEPPVLLGVNKGANPVEYLLAALAGCLTTSMVLHAAAKGIRLTKVRSSYEGDIDLHGLLGLDDNVRNGYQQIRVSFEIEGEGLTEEDKRELVEMAQRHSPVFDSIRNPVPIQVGVSIA